MERPFFFSANPSSDAGRHRRRYQSHRTVVVPGGPKPRVVSIPIHLVGSVETPAAAKLASAPPSEAVRSAAASAIQRVVRGHLVRKNVWFVSQVAAEVGEIDRMVRSEEQWLQVDPQEWLRLVEMLMALLFRLDSVRGVREYRKKVIQRVMALQEFLDSISAQAQTLESDLKAPVSGEMRPEICDPHVVLEEAEEMPRENNSEEETAADSQERHDSGLPAVEDVVSQENQDPILAIIKDAGAQGRGQVSDASDAGFLTLDRTDDLKKEEVVAAEGFVMVSMEEAIGRSLDEYNEANMEKATISESMEKENKEMASLLVEEAPGISTTMAEAKTGEAGFHMAKDSMPGVSELGKGSADASGMAEMLKKVMAESERVQGLVAALWDRNGQQCNLMAGLVERVAHLEQTVQNMEKKTRHANYALASSVDKKRMPTQQ